MSALLTTHFLALAPVAKGVVRSERDNTGENFFRKLLNATHKYIKLLSLQYFKEMNIFL